MMNKSSSSKLSPRGGGGYLRRDYNKPGFFAIHSSGSGQESTRLHLFKMAARCRRSNNCEIVNQLRDSTGSYRHIARAATDTQHGLLQTHSTGWNKYRAPAPIERLHGLLQTHSTGCYRHIARAATYIQHVLLQRDYTGFFRQIGRAVTDT